MSRLTKRELRDDLRDAADIEADLAEDCNRLALRQLIWGLAIAVAVSFCLVILYVFGDRGDPAWGLYWLTAVAGVVPMVSGSIFFFLGYRHGRRAEDLERQADRLALLDG